MRPLSGGHYVQYVKRPGPLEWRPGASFPALPLACGYFTIASTELAVTG